MQYDLKKIPHQLRVYRTEVNLTSRRVAELINRSIKLERQERGQQQVKGEKERPGTFYASTITKIETGALRITIETLLYLLDTYGKSFEDLLNDITYDSSSFSRAAARQSPYITGDRKATDDVVCDRLTRLEDKINVLHEDILQERKERKRLLNLLTAESHLSEENK